VALLVWLAVSIVVSVRHERAALERTRQALFAQWSAEATSLKPEDHAFLDRVQHPLADLRGAYAGDFIAPELRLPEALARLLARSAIYFRATEMALDGSPAAIARAASESGKDTLLLCLLIPPPNATEKTLLAKARLAMAGGAAFMQPTQTAMRLNDVQAGLPVLQKAWGDRIRAAKTESELQQLEREFKRAPLGSTKRALHAELLIGALDERSDGGSVTELDGEAPHNIRLVVTELASNRVLIRLRRHADPSWITANRRPQYARELDGCRFALDVHGAVHGLGSP
jgi:hypothetical protein